MVNIGDEYRSRPELERMVKNAVGRYADLQAICMTMLSAMASINKVAEINCRRVLQAPDLAEAWNTVKNMTDEHAETMKSKDEYDNRSNQAGKPFPAGKP